MLGTLVKFDVGKVSKTKKNKTTAGKPPQFNVGTKSNTLQQTNKVIHLVFFVFNLMAPREILDAHIELKVGLSSTITPMAGFHYV